MLIPVSSRAAAVAPANIEIAGNRGEVATATFSIINISATEQTYYLGTMKFEPKEESGSPQFIPYEEDHSGLAEWIRLPGDSVKVPANTKNEYQFSVDIPGSVDSGGYYAALTVSGSPLDLVASNGAIVDSKTAMLVFLTVKGETVRKAEILDLKKESGITNMDQGFSYRVQNQGNVHIVPKGDIKISGLLGRNIKTISANKTEGRVLPGTTRLFEVKDGESGGFFEKASLQMRDFALGRLKAEVNLDYGNGVMAVAQTSFWYLPVELLALVLGMLIVLVGTFVRISKKRRH